ncbi:MAG: hypothetical protein K2I75_04550 [Clostridiales bacterium]|nr:hypothetical protein [Clostridiales bacterium]
MKIFANDEYNFVDSILCGIKRDGDSADYLITVDLYLGKDKNKILPLKLKNVKRLNVNANVNDGDVCSAYTLSHIEKRYVAGGVELFCYSLLAFLPEHENDTLLYCLCDEVYVEK